MKYHYNLCHYKTKIYDMVLMLWIHDIMVLLFEWYKAFIKFIAIVGIDVVGV